MAAISTIAGIVSALAAVASTAYSLSNATSGPSTPMIQNPPPPAGPEKDLTDEQLRGRAPTAPPVAPNFLQFGSGMTNQQRRAQIATFGAQGSDSRYSDPATRDYYKKLVSYDYAQPGFNLLPTEKQYGTNVLGASPRGDSTESFLSAILRG